MALPASDNFTGTDSDPLSGSWTVIMNTFDIQTNRAHGIAVDFNIAKWTADTFGDDQKASCIPTDVGDGIRAGICLRLTGTNAATTSGYVILHDNDGVIRTWACVNGNFDTPGVIDERTPTAFNGTTDVLSAELTGTSLVYKRNESAIGSPLTVTNFASGQAGIVAYANHLDTFTADNIGGAPLILTPTGSEVSAQSGTAVASLVFSALTGIRLKW